MPKPAKKNPSSIIYWNDLENDEQLRTCSLAAKGLWDHHMLPIAARSNEPGVILLGNHPSRLDGDLPALLARAVGESPDVIATLLRELIDSGAASVDDEGRVFNRRMVREEEARQQRVEAGRKGGKAPRKTKMDAKRTPQQNDSGDGSEKRSEDGSGGNAVTAEPVTDISAEAEAQPERTPEQNGSETEASSFLQDSSRSFTAPPSSTSAAASSRAQEAAAADDDLAIPGFLKRASDAAPISTIDRETEDAAFAAFQEAANRLGWPNPPMFLDSGRRPMLRAKLTECGGLQGWMDALRTAEGAAFLRESDGRWKWWFKLNWLLEPQNFSKLMEGNYDRRHREEGSGTPEGGAPTVLDAVAAARARRSVPAGG